MFDQALWHQVSATELAISLLYDLFSEAVLGRTMDFPMHFNEEIGSIVLYSWKNFQRRELPHES